MSESPAVRVTLGEPIADVVRHSTFDLTSRVRPGEAIDMVAVTEPVALTYAGPGRTFSLPTGRFLSLDVDAGSVVGVAASPHLAALSLDDALALAGRVGDVLAGAGWTRSAGGRSAGTVAAAARADDSGFFRADLDRWSAAGDQVTVRLRQVADASGGPSTRRYLVNVELDNPDVTRRLGARAVQAIERQRAARAPD